ncbi:glycosyltransferase family 4 protein [Rhodocaloribacter litoris]|uniref:glycosyltransferase family 4 protein n=1 Tax=Rhodocaloribacter litoris TaxID=2558931 RepID=UPI0014240D08|nr:glycosyltransferase family 4 protein [Rhodocaloribacter litoris]QXD13710.1 glycosyltransferase family 4 protein [Rhodocaloribacter litoris]
MPQNTLRLLYVSHSFPPAGRPLANLGGMQRVATELFEALRRRPDLKLSAHLLQSSWTMHWLRGPAYMIRGHRHIRRLIQQRAIDAILFSSIVTPALMWLPKKLLRESGIITAAIVHGRDVTTPIAPYQHAVRRAFDVLDAVLPVSRASAGVCRERGVPDEKLHVIPNGINLKRFRPLADRETMRRELVRTFGPLHVPPDDGLLLCSVGRQVPRKGFAWFVEHVMPLLPEDVHYWLAGDGPEADNIRAAVARRGLEHRVRLLGRVSEKELETLYRGADLFIMPNVPMPNDLEGFGVVMLEAALGGGLPTIAARLEGIRDVISEGVNGHLIESGDAWGFSEAVMAYYHNRPALEAASHRAAAFTAENFCWSAIAERHVTTLRTLVTGVPAPAPLEATAALL